MYLWKLLDKLKDYKLTQVAGFEGLNRNIRWFHIAEDETLSNFIIGDELVFTTGVKMNGNSVALLGFVKAMLKYGAGGIVINTGKYINEIPQKLKDFCNENRLPLFVMPWEIRLVDVGKASSTAILEDERFSVNFRNAVNTALFLPGLSKDSLSLFSEYGFSEEMNYTVLVISSKNEEIEKMVNDCIPNLNSIAFVTSVGGDIVVILSNKNGSSLFGEATAMQGKIKTMALCGVSDVFKGISNLSKGYHSAQTNKISGKANARKILENHSQYEILLEIKDDEKIRAYCNETIGPIIKYDKAHNTNLYQTLKCYFDNNASVNKTSAQMFIHRNTINYKIKKIEHILSCDLSSFEERFTLMLAIKLLEMYA